MPLNNSARGNISKILLDRSFETPDHKAFVFVNEQCAEECLSYRDIHIRSSTIASALRSIAEPGARVILLCPTSSEFIAGFFGCLYAGVVPVPASPPSRRTQHRLLSMISNCDPAFIITTRKFSETFDGKLQTNTNSKNPETIFLDDFSRVEDFQPTDASSDQLAFLQYTSGSTDLPKGVMVTHGNLWHNLNRIRSCFDAQEAQEGSMSVSWLPLFHDMGLIGQMIGAVYAGVGCVLMQPSSFLRAPLSWVEVISKYRAFCAGGPNFAYDLCVQAASERQPQDLDLSHWKVAFSGAEPVRAGTLKRFAECFAPYGFHSDAFLPVYGLAESTLLVASGKRASRVKTMHLDPQELENNRAITVDPQRSDARQIICCGTPDESERIEIVDPDKLCRVAEGCIGEIWVSSPSIAAGYWGNPQASQETFMARLSTDPSRLYCRTGDLGYIHQGSLYITGRLKDLIIIRGRNHYPNDIESATAMCHTAIEASGVAAIGVTVDEEEKLVVLAEIGRSSRGTVDLDEVSAAIRKAVYESHSLSIHEICLLQLGQLPRTTSGKIQRHACRISYLDKSLKPANSKPKTPSTQPLAQVPSTGQSVSRQKADRIINWLRDYSQERINSRLIDERRCIPPYIVLDFGNRGLLGMVTTEEFGGQGMLISDSMRVIEQLAAIDLTLASFVGIQHALGIHPIEHHAQPQVRQRWLPELAKGRQLAAFAITEPQAGSNPNAMVSKALPEGENHWRIHGQKSWIGTAAWAGVINVFARQYDSAGNHIGVSGFVVPQESKGLRMGPEALTMGVRGMVQNSVFFKGVSVHAMDLLGEQGRGMQVAHEAMMLGRLGICAMSVGAMKRCAQLMMRYAQRRSIATGRLVDNPLTQQRLSELTLCISVVDNLTHAVGRSLDDHKTIPAEAFAVCKIAGPECLATATDQLMQMLGGRGYIETNMVPQMLRDARLLRIFEGPSETLLAFLGSQAIVGSQGLFGFIKEALQAPQVATALHDALLKIQQQTPSDGTNRYNLAFCAGKLVTQATLWAAACWGVQSRPEQQPQNAVPWAKSRFDQTLWEILRQDHFVFATPELFSNIQSYQSSIGQVDQAMAGEDSQIDPWIAAENQTIEESSNAQVDNQPTPLQATPSEITLEAPVVPTHIDSKSIEEWIIGWLIEKLKVDPKTIRPNQPITQFGLDSVIAVKLILDLEKKFQRQVSIEQFWETPTIESLARWVCGSAPKTATTTKTQPQSDPIPASSGVSASVALTEPVMQTAKGMELSVFFFSSPDPSERTDKYQLVLEASKFADENGFKAVWVPERHFHPFGGLYPNPSTLAAAIAMITKRIRIRSGSVVLPLHDPIRVAEEWSLVDNLSSGRVDLSFTKGWNPDDFVFYPDRFETRQQWLESNLDQVRRLWRGETIQRVNGLGKSWIQGIYPRPVQEELPVWLTCNTSPEGFQWAGANGINLLTALLGQSLEELAEKIALYRRAREQAGHDPDTGHVTLMLHTFAGTSSEQVRQTVREPLRSYLQDSLHLWAKNVQPLKGLSEKEKDKSLDYAFERYYRTSALMGDRETCLQMIERAKKARVDEIACLIDFGVETQAALESLKLVSSMIKPEWVKAPLTASKPTRRIPQEPFRLALQQQSLWVNYKLDPKSAAYNQALAIRITGPIDLQRAHASFHEAIAKEPILTCTFHEGDQGVWRKSSTYHVPALILDNLNPEQSVEDWLDCRIQEPFDLYSGPPIRIDWLKLASDDHILLIVNHHIVADARAIGLLVRHGLDIYQKALGYESHSDSSKADKTYEEFVEQQSAWLTSSQAKEQIEYWQKKLSGNLPILELPYDRTPKPQRIGQGYTTSGSLGSDTTVSIGSLAKKLQTTPARLLLAVYSLWLHRICGQDSLVTGLASHGLPDPSYANVIGHFVNPLTIRTDYDSSLRFEDWVDLVDKTVSEAFQASRCTFANIVEALRPERIPGRTPIFQTLFNFLGGNLAAPKLDRYCVADLSLSPLHVRQQEGQFDLSVEFIEKADDIIFDLKVAKDVFDLSTAQRFRMSFLNLLDQAVSQPISKISDLQLVPPGELNQLSRWSTNDSGINELPMAYELIQRQVESTPDATAVKFVNQSMNYSDLNAAANQLACHLRSLGARPDTPIGIYLDRSIDLIISVLAVMKSGAAFLPLNVNEPWIRTQAVLQDSRPCVVITQEGFEDRWNTHPTKTVFLDRDRHVIQKQPKVDLESLSKPSDLAYIMYTSGSTGRPKGVEVEHRNLSNFLESMRHEPGISSSDIVLAVTPLTFDISILELLLPLCVGATVVIASRTQATDANRLSNLLSQSKATWMQATPSHWGMLIESKWSPSEGFTALCGGEAMSRDLANKLLARCKVVWNMYGPTETTIWSAIYRVTNDDSNVPIGLPIQKTELLVLDKQLGISPIGTPGELYISGAGVARGYLNSPELTSERFLEHPGKPNSGIRMYRTGDRARWSPRGVLEFLGRSDNQVKIRGHRIEPAEIETVLRSHPMIKEAIVIPHEEPTGNKRLVAHVSLNVDSNANLTSELRRFLSMSLPDYMVPVAYVTHSKMPLTPHGKIDRKALEQISPISVASETAFEGPRNELEQQISAVWADVLGIQKLSIHDNYFELGGDSLLAMKLILRLSNILGMEISVADLFHGQTVAQMAQSLSKPNWVDWDNEMTLPTDFRVLSHHSDRPAGKRRLLLTGATGFIGSHILRDILEHTQDDVSCLVHEKDTKTALDRLDACFANYQFKSLVDRKRVQIVCGNLSKLALGLDLATWNELSSKIDLIVHAGAWVNFAFPYQALRPVNVQGTIELLRFSCQGNHKSMVFVSSLTALDDSKTYAQTPPTELDGPGKPENLATGYAQTKAVSERLLEQAAKLGLSITRLRVGLISGASASGAWSNDQWLPQALRASAVIRQFPLEFADKTLRLMPVDYASNAIVQLLGETIKRPEVIHLDGKPIGFDEIIDRLPGGRPELVSFSDWLQMLKRSTERFEPGVIDGLLAILSNPNEFISPILPDVSTAKSRAFLESIGVKELTLDPRLIERYWKYLLGNNTTLRTSH